ncbi:MAG: flippase [Chloroflexota bacterium]|nr:flippase [Chloroflexota bacterium]
MRETSVTTIAVDDPQRQPSRIFVIVRNMLSILGSDIANRASSFALYVLVARFLGEFSMGQMALAQQTFFFLGYSLAGLGVRWFIARELSGQPQKTESYLVNGTVMVLGTSALMWLAFLVVTIASGYADMTRNAILLMAVTIFPYTMMMVLEGTFIGREKMHFVFLINAPMNVINIAAVFVVLNNGGNLFHVIAIQVIAYILIALIEWGLMLRFVARPEFRPQWSEIKKLARATSSFFGIDAVVAVLATMQLYLISLVGGESRVGLYSSAYQLFQPTLLIITSLVGSMLPVMTRMVEPGYHKLKIGAERLAELLLWISIPAVVGLVFVASDLLVFIFGRESYAEAGLYLQIIAGSLIFRSIVNILGYMLYASKNEHYNLRIVTVSSVLSLAGNLFAIINYGSLGAAFVFLFLNIADFIMHSIVVWRVMKITLNPLPIFWRATLASGVMAAALYLLADQPVLIRIIAAGSVYAVSMGVILFATVGGPRKIKERYLSRPSDAPAASEVTALSTLAEPD